MNKWTYYEVRFINSHGDAVDVYEYDTLKGAREALRDWVPGSSGFDGNEWDIAAVLERHDTKDHTYKVVDYRGNRDALIAWGLDPIAELMDTAKRTKRRKKVAA